MKRKKMMGDGVRGDALMGGLLSAVLLLSNILYVSAYMGFLHEPNAVLETDHYRYIEMAKGQDALAQNPLANQAPFCWRVLSPFLVFLLTRTGLNLDFAYYLTTNLFLFGFLFLLYLYLRKLGLEPGWAALGLILAGLMQGAIRWHEYQYWMTDPIGLFVVIAGFYFIETGREKHLLILSVLALTAKENYVIVFGYYFLRRLRKSGVKQALGDTIALVIAPIIVVALIRYYIVPINTYDIPRTIAHYLRFRLENLFNNQLYFCTLGTFGVLLPLLLMFPRGSVHHFRESYEDLGALILVLASLTAGSNTDRYLAYGLPVLLPVALRNAKRLTGSTGVPAWIAIAAMVFLQLMFYVLTRFHGQFAISRDQPTNWTVIFGMTLFWIFFQLRMRFQGSRLVAERG